MNKRLLLAASSFFLVVALLFVFRQPLTLKMAEWTLQSYLQDLVGSPLQFQRISMQNDLVIIEHPSLLIEKNGETDFSFQAEVVKLSYTWRGWKKIDADIVVDKPRLHLAKESTRLLELVAPLGYSSSADNLHLKLALNGGEVAVDQERPLHFQLTAEHGFISPQHLKVEIKSWFDPLQPGVNSLNLTIDKERGPLHVSAMIHQLSAASLSPILAPFASQLTRWQVKEGVLDGEISLAIQSKQIESKGELKLHHLSAQHRFINLGVDTEQLLIHFGQQDGEIARIDSLKEATLTFTPQQGHVYQINKLAGYSALSNLDHLHFEWQGLCSCGKGRSTVEISGKSSLGKGSSKHDSIKIALQGSVQEWAEGLPTTFKEAIEREFSGDLLSAELSGHKDQKGMHFSGSASVEPSDHSSLAHSVRFGFDLHHAGEPQFLEVVRDAWFEAASFREKYTGLLFSDIKGRVNFQNNNMRVQGIETFLEGVYLGGNADFDFSAEKKLEIDIHTDVMSGKASQFNRIISIIKKSPESEIPVEGNLSLVKEGGKLHLILEEGKDPELQIRLQGAFSDGVMAKAGVEALIQDLSFNFDYDHHQDTLSFEEIQGSLIVGNPGNVEEYIIAAEKIRFLDLSKNQLEFDFWIGDKKRDLLRLAGKTVYPQKEENRIIFTFDDGLTHVGDMHPETIELSLKNWSEVDAFKFNGQLRLNTLFRDLQRFSRNGFFSFSPGFLKQLNGIKNVGGLINFGVNYDSALGYFTYSMAGEGLLVNHYHFDKILLTGKKSGSLWTIDQLLLNDLSLSADLSRQQENWKINFLGFRYGKSLLVGLKGTYFPHDTRLSATLNLLEVNLGQFSELSFLRPFVEQLNPQGELKAIGNVEVDFFKGEDFWRAVADLKTTSKGVSLKGIALPLVDDARIQVAVDPRQTKIMTQVIYENHPFNVQLQTEDPTFSQGELILSENQNYPLRFLWDTDPNTGYYLSKVEGQLAGLDIDLSADQQDKKTLAGTVFLNLHRAKEYLPVELSRMTSYFNMGNGYQLVGHWSYGKGVNPFAFKGTLKGKDFDLKGYTLKTLTADLLFHHQLLDLKNVKVEDPAGELAVKALKVWQDKRSQEWLYEVDSLAAKNFQPSLLKTAEPLPIQSDRPLVLSSLDLLTMKGKVYDWNSWSGKGQFSFSTLSKKVSPHPLFAFPIDLINRLGLDVAVLSPAYGEIFYEISGERIYLTKLKDVYSEGKLSKFTLPKAPYTSYLDFSGNLSIQLRMKQYNLLFKFADLLTLNVQGTLQQPVYSLQKQGLLTKKELTSE